jgi:hypothetical protein
MERLHAHYDRFAAKWSLNWAITMTTIYAFVGCIGLFQLLKYFQRHDNFYLFFALLTMPIGAFGIFHGWQIIHAVVRRLQTAGR